ncbi:MAG: polyprenyl synthetase family protein [Dehalococcoidia bacterium]|nr:polyprenyl synthetase family protein [Dehalococcoidia bacterium]
MMAYHMGWMDASGQVMESSATQGKALRPTLCMFACDSLGGDCSRAVPAASALELIHNFSLVHDDIQDGDVERRHQPTVWYLWGEPMALTVGNALRAAADASPLRLTEQGVPTTKALRASQILTEGCLSMIQGQCMDLSFEGRLDIGPADYLDMVSKKTGALIRCGTEMGALIGCNDTASTVLYASAGAHLGIAFQVRDDVLGIWGDSEVTGKASGNDIRRRKKSFPIVYAMETASGAARQRLLEAYGKDTPEEEDVEDVLTVLDDVGAESYAHQMAVDQGELASGELRKIPVEPWAQAEFDDLVQFLTARQH